MADRYLGGISDDLVDVLQCLHTDSTWASITHRSARTLTLWYAGIVDITVPNPEKGGGGGSVHFDKHQYTPLCWRSGTQWRDRMFDGPISNSHS